LAGARQVRQRLRRELASPRWRELLPELDHPDRHTLTALVSTLSAGEPLAAWRAVTALGRAAAAVAGQDAEAGREIMRRLAWSLNEESGAVPWGAPQAMGEIMARSPELAPEFANLLLSYVSPCENQLDFAPLLAGALWGVGRLARARPGLLRARCAEAPAAALLEHPEPAVRGHAAWALAGMPWAQAPPALGRLREDGAAFVLYRGGGLEETTVGAEAAEAAEALGAPGGRGASGDSRS
jgi:hypothetical protein